MVGFWSGGLSSLSGLSGLSGLIGLSGPFSRSSSAIWGDVFILYILLKNFSKRGHSEHSEHSRMKWGC